ncbi:MAG: DNA-protecting protein DprA [Bdellovibrionales bacterium]|nr:DNA-protecting protein DprA [Bdellovibrionales bacterium]
MIKSEKSDQISIEFFIDWACKMHFPGIMWETQLAVLSQMTTSFRLKDFLDLHAIDLLGIPQKDWLPIVENPKLRKWLSMHPNWQNEANDVIERSISRGFEIYHPAHHKYPTEFYRLSNPPISLFVSGRISNLKKLSVVGSREPRPESIEWMERYLGEVVKEGVSLVSGAARGVDQAAHRISLREKTPTVAFLPSGLNRVYPTDFLRWHGDIVHDGGALVSEYLPDIEMQRSHFEARNRLIAALSPLTLVVESRRRSGTLITARHALQVGREVATISQSPLYMKGWGGLDLLFDGAHLIRDADDLRDLLSRCQNSISSASSIK